MKVALLLTCHNRKDVTLCCLRKVYDIEKNIDVFCVDDNSSDGTYEAITKEFPQVHLFPGDGNLFWCRGMRKAWEEALQYDQYDFYIWINDDMELYDNAFQELFLSSEKYDHKAIISGLVQETVTKKAIYGGFDERRQIIEANGCNKPIDRLNGNFVLVPKSVVEAIGIFDPVYHHDIGDVDYGFMAHKKNIPVVSTRCYIGSTSEKLKSKNLRIRRYGVTLRKRFKCLYAPLGAPPRIHYHFIKKHYGVVKAIGYYCYLHVINVLPDAMWDVIQNKTNKK